MRIIIVALLIIITFSCSRNINNLQSISNAKTQIRKVMKNQEKAWSQGNISDFMAGYWKSDSLKFVGSRGISYGWRTTLENYKKSYPDTKTMGKLHFDIDLIEKLSDDTYYLIGRYTLKREKDAPSGYFNLIWRKINGKWKIITDMTCG
jgi:ketosteroid isomerase-like protein